MASQLLGTATEAFYAGSGRKRSKNWGIIMSNYDSQSYRTAPLIADAVSRRQIIVCSAIGIGSVGVAAASTGTQEASDRTATSKEITAAKAIHQEENFKASAARIYEALLNAKQ